jgi:antitoxin ParD1/3/4
MAQMNISVTDQLKSWAESRVAEGRYSSTSDYVRDLLRRDQDEEAKRRNLMAEIELGRQSPDSDKTIASILAEARHHS